MTSPILASHELPAAKRGHVFGPELEPLAVFPAICEASVPVPLDAHRIVCLDEVDGRGSLGQLDCDLPLATAEGIRAPDLEVRTRLEEVDGPELDSGLPPNRPPWRLCLGDGSQHGEDILVALALG